jgi:hypothetical protein
LKSKENDDSRDSNTGGEGGGNDKVVFGPETGVLSSEILPREPNDGHIGKEVAQIVWTTPESRACRNHNGMNLSEEFGFGVFPSEKPVNCR